MHQQSGGQIRKSRPAKQKIFAFEFPFTYGRYGFESGVGMILRYLFLGEIGLPPPVH
jgi:hypothetical protein